MSPLVAFLVAALVSNPIPLGQDPTIKPGSYDLEIVYGGGTADGTLVVSLSGDSIAIKLTVAGHESPVRPTRRDGARLVLEGGAGIAIRYELEFTGDLVSGKFVYDGQPGAVTGRRRGGS
jgi:hypothetical protein